MSNLKRPKNSDCANIENGCLYTPEANIEITGRLTKLKLEYIGKTNDYAPGMFLTTYFYLFQKTILFQTIANDEELGLNINDFRSITLNELNYLKTLKGIKNEC